MLIEDVHIYQGGRITSDSPEYTAEMNLSDGDTLYLYLSNEYIRVVPSIRKEGYTKYWIRKMLFMPIFTLSLKKTKASLLGCGIIDVFFSVTSLIEYIE